MPTFAKIVLGLGLLTLAGACARQEPQPVTYAEPLAPIEAEPTFSKY